jgi:FkbM family methyltransferase
MISYAQAREDVLLHRALRHVHHDSGFYIDVGGFDPNHDSVTRHFYEHGWHGVNVEPARHLFAAFERDRERDINLQLAVSDRIGEVEFFEIENGQLGTLEQRFAEQHAAEGMATRSYKVPCTTLTEICDQHAKGEIHFLKVDVEGHEGAVLRGMDFKRFRPWVLVIEATEPNRLDRPTYDEWDEGVRNAGYEFVHTDVLNRYYVAREHAYLARHFAVPADDYVYDWVRREHHAAEAVLRAQLEQAAAREQALIGELEQARGKLLTLEGARRPAIRSLFGGSYKAR